MIRHFVDLVFGGFVYNHMAKLMAITCPILRLLPYRPHSARAGFATDSNLAGVPFNEISETMRQQNDKSFRVYLDATASYSALTRSDDARWGDGLHGGGILNLPDSPAVQALRQAAMEIRRRRI